MALFYGEDGYRNLKFSIQNITQNRLFTHISVHFPGPFTQKQIMKYYEESFSNLTKLNPVKYQAWRVANDNLRRTMWAKNGINKTHVSLTKNDIEAMDPIVWRHLLNTSSIHVDKVRTTNGTEVHYIVPLAKAVHVYKPHSASLVQNTRHQIVNDKIKSINMDTYKRQKKRMTINQQSPRQIPGEIRNLKPHINPAMQIFRQRVLIPRRN